MAASFGLMELTRLDPVLTVQAQEAISAGWLVYADPGKTDVVTSLGVSSLAAGDLAVWTCNDNSGSFACGIALENMGASGSYGSVATQGLYIVRTQAAVDWDSRYGMGCVAAGGEDMVQLITVGTNDACKIGTFLTGATASGSYAVFRLNV